MSTKPAFQAVGSVPGGSPECNYKVNLAPISKKLSFSSIFCYDSR
jgi:hypothetical protein